MVPDLESVILKEKKINTERERQGEGETEKLRQLSQTAEHSQYRVLSSATISSTHFSVWFACREMVHGLQGGSIIYFHPANVISFKQMSWRGSATDRADSHSPYCGFIGQITNFGSVWQMGTSHNIKSDL